MPQINNNADCTLATCPLSQAPIDYDPSLGGNAFFLAIFSLILVIQALQLWRYKTWSFSCSMMGGLLLEMIGYVGRVQMHFNPFDANPFLIYLTCITIGPVFFAAAVYLTLSRIIVHYGISHSRFSPKTISLGFMSCDFLALVLQATGGAIADTANTKKGSDQGTHIMVAGLSFQVLTLLLFIAVGAKFALNVRKDRKERRMTDRGRHQWTETGERKGSSGRSERSFKMFLFGITISTMFILTRSCFRVAELAKGFGSKLANEEIPFMILEGAMITLATMTLTIFHPGWAFGSRWSDAGWSWKKNQDSDIETREQPSPVSLRELK